MVQTRSMLKTDTDSNIVVRSSKQTRKKAGKNAAYYLKRPIDMKAMCIFMKDYMIRHIVPNMKPIQIDAVDCAGQEEWNQMSDLQKAPFIKMVMESTEKRATETATDSNIVVRSSKQTRKKDGKNADYYLKRPTIDRKAMCIFMKDYMIRQIVPNMIPIQIDAVDCAGQEEWKQMSDLQKAPFIKTVLEKRDKMAKPAH